MLVKAHTVGRALSDPRGPLVVLLRVVVGAWFVKAVWTKFTLAYWGRDSLSHGVPALLASIPSASPSSPPGTIDWYKEFLEGNGIFFLPNSRVFATLQTFGEAAVGLGLILRTAHRPHRPAVGLLPEPELRPREPG